MPLQRAASGQLQPAAVPLLSALVLLQPPRRAQPVLRPAATCQTARRMLTAGLALQQQHRPHPRPEIAAPCFAGWFPACSPPGALALAPVPSPLPHPRPQPRPPLLMLALPPAIARTAH